MPGTEGASVSAQGWVGELPDDDEPVEEDDEEDDED